MSDPSKKLPRHSEQSKSELVQIAYRRGHVRGESHGYMPPELIKLHLEPHQRVVQIEWSRGHDYPTRKTVDWTWTVWVESRLGGPSAEPPHGTGQRDA